MKDMMALLAIAAIVAAVTLAITSFAMFGDRNKIIEAGCTAYFEKPIDPLTIVDRIHEAIGVKNE